MTDPVGVMLATNRQDQAVLLDAAEADVARTLIATVMDRPTVAGGEVDLEVLTELSDLLRTGDDAAAPKALSPSQQSTLELLVAQAGIRSSLPLRVRHKCQVCGTERVIDPGRKPTAPSGSDVSVSTMVESFQLLSQGHPFLAAISFLGEMASVAPAESEGLVCQQCDGTEFESIPVTFCPGCYERRDETVLLTCPKCGFDFQARTEGGDVAWEPFAEVHDRFKVLLNRALLTEQARFFENSLWPGQLNALLAAVGADERLLGMCRCGRPGEIGRYVALLFTSDKLVWARETPFSGVTNGTVAWSDVREIADHVGSGSTFDQGFQLTTSDGTSQTFNDFRGKGVTLTGDPLAFDIDGIRTVIRCRHAQSAMRG